jgi:hypothetical protein
MNTDDFSHSDVQLCRKRTLRYRRRRVVLVGRFVGAMFGGDEGAMEQPKKRDDDDEALLSLSLSFSL